MDQIHRVAAVTARLNEAQNLIWDGVTVSVEGFGVGNGVSVIIDANYTPVLRDFARDVKAAVLTWDEVTGPVVIRWVGGGKLGVVFHYVPEQPKKDAYGNMILAEVNGWTIVGGEFCYVLTQGSRTEVHRGNLDGAKALAARI